MLKLWERCTIADLERGPSERVAAFIVGLESRSGSFRSIGSGEALEDGPSTIGGLPPLVTSWEVERLKGQLAEAAAGRRFLLQGGDCAESFDHCRPDVITNKLKILLQMSLVLTHGLKRQIIRVGRFAGQYAKPRSANTETRDGVTCRATAATWSTARRSPRPTARPTRSSCCAATSTRP